MDTGGGQLEQSIVEMEEDRADDIAATTSESAPTAEPPAGKQKNSRKRTKTGCLTCRKRRIKCGEERPRCNNCVKSKRNCEGYNQRVIFKDPIHGYRPQVTQTAITIASSQRPTAPKEAQKASHTHLDASAPPQLPPIAPRPYDIQHTTELRQPSTQEQSTPGDHTVSMPGGLSPSVQLVVPAQDMFPTEPGAAYPGRDIPCQPFAHTPQGSSHPHWTDPLSNVLSRQPITLSLESDDLYDAQDEEMEEDEPLKTASECDMLVNDDIVNRLGPLLPLHSRFDDSSMRTFRTLLNEPNMLATYQPSLSTSPLTDPRTARIFAHFVSATGPSLSIFERHPTNPSVIFTEGPVPKARQSLWTYTIPTLALTHPALMQAILAVSSLHIAKLQDCSPISSLKHYHVSIKRLKKSVGLPSSRAGIGTLAATMLLGFYEVIAGEHSKWNSHLLGAKQLLQEIDFAGMTEQLKFMKAQEEAFAHEGAYSMGPTSPVYPYARHKPSYKQDLEAENKVDEFLISRLMGRSMLNDHYGPCIDGTIKLVDGRWRAFTTKELEDFQIRSDLFWWFCKQDVFQSILSGNRLLMEYRRWGGCLPRAAIGRLDAVYGTADHLWLLLGRLADFNARDQRRKRKAVDANGGQWKPPTSRGAGPQGGMNYANAGREGQWARMGKGPANGVRGTRHNGMGNGKLDLVKEQSAGGMAAELLTKVDKVDSDVTAQGYTRPRHETSTPSSAQIGERDFGGKARGSLSGSQNFTGLPPDPLNGMHGMVPPTPAAKMPEGFINEPVSPASSEDDGLELEAATIEAEKEWEDIRQALWIFEESLGPDYKYLSSEYQQPLATPFGPARYYRTYSIACIWAYYYTALILHHRTHPSMPPAAMMAAGVAAQQTTEYANEIGRICAGLIPTNHSGQVSPALGGVIAECVIPLFFAGIQYRDAGQRVYTVSKLREVARMTGWQSATAVAAGCESSWVRQGQLGKGPPYLRTRDLWAKDERVSGNLPGPNDPVVDSNSDRRFIQVNPRARVHWAIGIIGVEEDMENLSV
ncbi:MAG: hypothetical protein M1813_002517 [Trichoglossum hirsutum]|nr:MAG: hypothetical protein M1813_002517 [Trichoglossum hirsutum]